ncbi:hypothetical protein VNO78_20979 [Psophocarpus tetragonolobus]|uniref:Homeobox-leucine zipper protein n=1 Tax=Psophocarpus tetragonolobus TaxID=3891 RepID=A0AAN9SBE6_PSOTE
MNALVKEIKNNHRTRVILKESVAQHDTLNHNWVWMAPTSGKVKINCDEVANMSHGREVIGGDLVIIGNLARIKALAFLPVAASLAWCFSSGICGVVPVLKTLSLSSLEIMLLIDAVSFSGERERRRLKETETKREREKKPSVLGDCGTMEKEKLRVDSYVYDQIWSPLKIGAGVEVEGKRDKKIKPDMEWSGSTRHYVPRPESSLSFLYNYNYTPYPGMEVKQQTVLAETGSSMEKMNCGNQDKKKRLTTDQLDSLESSFQKEIKLDPDRKMKLSKELGLQPRQIAVWFQNRRARWKNKQLEHLYDSLKQEFDVISKEKQKLEEEVMKLKTMLREQGSRTQVSTGYTEISGEETVESTSEALRCSKRGTVHQHQHQHQHQQQNIREGNCSFTLEDYNTVPVLPYWPGVPYYP